MNLLCLVKGRHVLRGESEEENFGLSMGDEHEELSQKLAEDIRAERQEEETPSLLRIEGEERGGVLVKRVRVVRKERMPSDEGKEYDSVYVSPWDSSFPLYFIGLFLVTFASLITRLYKLSEPEHIA